MVVHWLLILLSRSLLSGAISVKGSMLLLSDGFHLLSAKMHLPLRSSVRDIAKHCSTQVIIQHSIATVAMHCRLYYSATLLVVDKECSSCVECTVSLCTGNWCVLDQQWTNSAPGDLPLTGCTHHQASPLTAFVHNNNGASKESALKPL